MVAVGHVVFNIAEVGLEEQGWADPGGVVQPVHKAVLEHK